MTWIAVKEKLLRQSVSIRDAAIFIAIVFLAGFVAIEYDFSGSLAPDKRIDFQEMLGLGIPLFVSVIVFAWQRSLAISISRIS
jgi:hypothetical protein